MLSSTKTHSNIERLKTPKPEVEVVLEERESPEQRIHLISEGCSVLEQKISSGGSVFSLMDAEGTLTPEQVAMAQAMYSRGSEGILNRLGVITKNPERAAKFMEIYYSKYGHKSIGDCGNIVLFVENVSMPAIKALQHSALYNGQEKSTRYIDFSEDTHILPQESKHKETVRDIQTRLQNLYTETYESLVRAIKERFPYFNYSDKKEAVWENTVKAKALDIARGLLPAGTRSSMAWSGEISSVNEHLEVLRGHPLAEVRDITLAIEKVLSTQYPSSFRVHEKLNQSSINGNKVYKKWFDPLYKDTEVNNWNLPKKDMENEGSWDGVNCTEVNMTPEFWRYINSGGRIVKERGQRLPRIFGHRMGTIAAQGMLDYASGRDLLRHRSLGVNLPVLNNKFGMHPWYMSELKKYVPHLVEKVENFVTSIPDGKSDADKFALQYAMPMGLLAPFEIAGPLDAWAYVLEQRTNRNVHPTLVNFMAGVKERLTKDHKLPVTFPKHELADEFPLGRGNKKNALKL